MKEVVARLIFAKGKDFARGLRANAPFLPPEIN